MEIEHTMEGNYERRMEDVPELKIYIKSEIDVKEEPIEKEKYIVGFCDEKNWNSDSLKSQEEANGSSFNNSSSLDVSLPVKLEFNKYKIEMEDDQERRMEDVTEEKSSWEEKKKAIQKKNKVVPPKSEKKTMHYLMSEFTENLLVYKDTSVLRTSLYEMKKKDLSFMNSVLRELTAKYKFNLKRLNNVKEKKDNDEDEIKKELYNLKVIRKDFSDGREILNEVKNMIKNDSFSDNDDMSLISENLTKAKKNGGTIPLYASYIKASCLFHMQKYKKNKDIIIQFKLSRRQFHYYMIFYKLIQKYNSLIRINLPFSKITKNSNKIEKLIEDDKELQNICQIEVPFLKE